MVLREDRAPGACFPVEVRRVVAEAQTWGHSVPVGAAAPTFGRSSAA